jgi:hypothetical protein
MNRLAALDGDMANTSRGAQMREYRIAYDFAAITAEAHTVVPPAPAPPQRIKLDYHPDRNHLDPVCIAGQALTHRHRGQEVMATRRIPGSQRACTKQA